MNETGNKANNAPSPWPRRFAVLLALVTFPLIWAGGLVTTTDAGMAVPDWPGTYGYNMFAYPWSTWFFGPWDLFIEHGHRLLGSLAGLVTIGLVVVAFRCDQRRWFQVASIVALLLVITQGVLGGVRVLADDRFIAKIHGCVGPAFFAFSAALIVCSSRFWREAEQKTDLHISGRHVLFIRIVTFLTLLIAYTQLVIGAHLRHIAIDASPHFFSTLILVHLALAAMVMLHIFFANFLLQTSHYAGIHARGLSWLLSFLVLVQIGLGGATWVFKYGWPTGLNDGIQTGTFTILSKGMSQTTITTAHVATGSLIIAIAAAVAVRTWRVTCFNRPAQTDQNQTRKPNVSIGFKKVVSA